MIYKDQTFQHEHEQSISKNLNRTGRKMANGIIGKSIGFRHLNIRGRADGSQILLPGAGIAINYKLILKVFSIIG